MNSWKLSENDFSKELISSRDIPIRRQKLRLMWEVIKQN